MNNFGVRGISDKLAFWGFISSSWMLDTPKSPHLLIMVRDWNDAS